MAWSISRAWRFDTLDHDILTHKLQYFGVSGSALQLFKNYLTERKQYVVHNETRLEFGSISTGVPPGSILGPLLFIVYINDIAQSTSRFNSITYADDAIFVVRKQATLTLKQLNILRINGTIVECVDNFVLLGLKINKHLNWNHNNTDVANNIVKTVGILNTLKRYLPLNILRIIYNSLILPHLHYGILLWGHQPKQTKHIQVVQQRAVRMLTGSKFNCHTESLFKQTNLLTVNDIYKMNEIKFYYKLVNKQQQQYLNSFTHETNSDIHSRASLALGTSCGLSAYSI